jgi:hypothetical protein
VRPTLKNIKRLSDVLLAKMVSIWSWTVILETKGWVVSELLGSDVPLVAPVTDVGAGAEDGAEDDVDDDDVDDDPKNGV